MQILFVLGMVGGNPLPPNPFRSFKPSVSWLVHGMFLHGTLTISRQAFYSRLLVLLARVNALTTLKPIAQKDSVQKNNTQKDNVQKDSTKASGDLVQRWTDHPKCKRQTCSWKPVLTDEGMNLDNFEWRSSHKRSMKEEGSLSFMKREYCIHCEHVPFLFVSPSIFEQCGRWARDDQHQAGAPGHLYPLERLSGDQNIGDSQAGDH